MAFSEVLGDMNYWYNMQPYYDIENINTYPSAHHSDQLVKHRAETAFYEQSESMCRFGEGESRTGEGPAVDGRWARVFRRWHWASSLSCRSDFVSSLEFGV